VVFHSLFNEIKNNLTELKKLNMINAYLKFDEKSKNLYEFFRRTKEDIDVALCDSIEQKSTVNVIDIA